jgi:uncharacterized protein (DUF433 family)
MSEYVVTLSSQTCKNIEQLALLSRQTMEQVINEMMIQPIKYVVSRPGVQDGRPCSRGTRIPVWVLAAMHKQGDTAEDFLDAYPNLDATQVYAALSHYYEHRAAVDATIAPQNAYPEQRGEHWDE